MNRRNLLRLLLALAAVLVGIQLIPVWLVQTNPPVKAEPAWDTPRTRSLMQRACLDCHSNQTNWPWYAHVAPISWLVTLDTFRGRSHLNVSEWTPGQRIGEEGRADPPGEAIARVLRNGSMPPSYYLALHPEAKLSDVERQQLVDGVLATFK